MSWVAYFNGNPMCHAIVAPVINLSIHILPDGTPEVWNNVESMGPTTIVRGGGGYLSRHDSMKEAIDYVYERLDSQKPAGSVKPEIEKP